MRYSTLMREMIEFDNQLKLSKKIKRENKSFQKSKNFRKNHITKK